MFVKNDDGRIIVSDLSYTRDDPLRAPLTGP